MPVTLRPNQLVQVLDRLKSRRSGDQQQKDYQLEGEIRARIENILPDYEFIVDRWPDFKAVVGIVNKTKTKCPAFLCPQVLVYAEDTTALVTLLLQPGLVDWSSKIEFINVYEAEKEALEAGIPSHQDVQFRAEPYLIMRVDSKTIKQRPVPEGFKLTSIPSKLASLVNISYPFSEGKDTEIYIHYLLSKRPSCCLYDREGNVVGFALQYHYGFLGMLYVFEQYRGRGYGKVIMSHVAKRCLFESKVIYAHVSVYNEVSMKQQTSIGFERVALAYSMFSYPKIRKQAKVLCKY